VESGDVRRLDARFSGGNFVENRRLLRVAEQIAANKDLSVGRLALAWLLCEGDDIIPIPGARHLTHVEMNAAAVGVQLTAAERGRLRAIFPISACGAETWSPDYGTPSPEPPEP
jgi:aryl-alcohol dehydrogenase-like predicted oxidoreductase